MIKQKDYEQILRVRQEDPRTYEMVESLIRTYYSEISTASHDIKNLLSFIGSSYQLINEHHPEAREFNFWTDMGDAITSLINLMDRTTIYRYCANYKPDIVNLNNLLFELPDELDALYENQVREFSFDIQSTAIEICADYRKLKIALIELIKNCYEATQDNDTISICAIPDESLENISITFTNQITNKVETLYEDFDETSSEDSNTEKFCEPFYTTKPDHTGVGLSIVYEVCQTHNGQLSIKKSKDQFQVTLTLPIKSIN
jgi:signal transduction histidine kinase